jgi:hypothetical protein
VCVLDFSLLSSSGMATETASRLRLAGDEFDVIQSAGSPLPFRGCRLRSIRIADALILTTVPNALIGLPDSEGLEVPHLAIFPDFGSLQLSAWDEARKVFQDARSTNVGVPEPQLVDRLLHELPDPEVIHRAIVPGIVFLEANHKLDFRPSFISPFPLPKREFALVFGREGAQLPKLVYSIFS